VLAGLRPPSVRRACRWERHTGSVSSIAEFEILDAVGTGRPEPAPPGKRKTILIKGEKSNPRAEQGTPRQQSSRERFLSRDRGPFSTERRDSCVLSRAPCTGGQGFAIASIRRSALTGAFRLLRRDKHPWLLPLAQRGLDVSSVPTTRRNRFAVSVFFFSLLSLLLRK
jgi:hypothetical protein